MAAEIYLAEDIRTPGSQIQDPICIMYVLSTFGPV